MTFEDWAKEEFGVSDEQLVCTHLPAEGIIVTADFKVVCVYCGIGSMVVTCITHAKAAWIAATKAAGEK